MMFWTKFNQNWPSVSGEEDENKTFTGGQQGQQTTD